MNEVYNNQWLISTRGNFRKTERAQEVGCEMKEWVDVALTT